jgi:hypothetical protein
MDPGTPLDPTDAGTRAWPRKVLWSAITIGGLLLVAVVGQWISAHRAYARAEAFCAATPGGTAARDVTIRALDQAVQVRTDVEPGALVVRFEAWGPSDAVGECRMTVMDGYVSATRVVRL